MPVITKTKQKSLGEKNTSILLGLPWQQPRLILFVEALVVKGALVVKRDSLEMR